MAEGWTIQTSNFQSGNSEQGELVAVLGAGFSPEGEFLEGGEVGFDEAAVEGVGARGQPGGQPLEARFVVVPEEGFEGGEGFGQ